METVMKEKKKSFEMPHVIVVLLLIMLAVAILTYIVPSGQFERVYDPTTDRDIVQPDQFNFLDEKNPIGFLNFFQAIYQGFVEGADIIAGLLITCGVINFLEETGTFGAGLTKIMDIAEKKRSFKLGVILLFFVAFAAMGILGFGEASYPFYGITTSVILAIGYDRVTAMATIMMASCAGWASGMLNMYTTGISQKIVGLPIFSGLWYRVICFSVFFILALISVLVYCRKISKDPSKSYIADEYERQLQGEVEIEGIKNKVPMTHQHSLALGIYVIFLIIQGYCCATKGWGIGEVAGLYVIYAIILAVIFKVSPSAAAESVMRGASNVLTAGFVIGMARSIMIVLEQGQIVDTFVYYMGNLLTGKGPALTILLLFAFVTFLNFFVDSGSGKAVMMMPIMSPLGKILGINQQVMVLTYQFGDGFTDYLWPAGALVPCQLCGLKYNIWLKFAARAMTIQLFAGYCMVLIAHYINLGPF